MKAALFDVEGTLYTNQMGRGLLRYARAHGRRFAFTRYFAVVLPTYILRKLKLISDETLRRVAIRGLAGVLSGWTEAEAQAAFDWVIADYLLPTARPAVMARFWQHLAQGDQVVLVSGMPLPCLQRLGDKIGATGVIGTPIGPENGRYTGHTSAGITIGENKPQQARAFFTERALTIDWAASAAYGDSIHDQSLFSLVGHPVAVYPDPELRALAINRGWEILDA